MSAITVFVGLVSLLGYLVNRNHKTVQPSSDITPRSTSQAPAKLSLMLSPEDSDESDAEDSNSGGTDTVVLDEPAHSIVRATATTDIAKIATWRASLPSLGGQSYVFTFKMMIHKVNSFEGWAEKVKGVLQESQRQFRPLAEEINSINSRVMDAIESNRDQEPELESSESEVCLPASMGADNEVQDCYATAPKRQCVVSKRPAKDGEWVFEAVTSCVDETKIQTPFRRRKLSTMRPKMTKAMPFPDQSDDEQFCDGMKIINSRERRKTIDDDVDSDSEGDVSDVESEDSGVEMLDNHNMHFWPRRVSTPLPKKTEVEAAPFPSVDILEVPSDDEEFYEALKKIVIRERRTTIVDDVDSSSEWDTDDEKWDEEEEGMPITSPRYQRVEA